MTRRSDADQREARLERSLTILADFAAPPRIPGIEDLAAAFSTWITKPRIARLIDLDALGWAVIAGLPPADRVNAETAKGAALRLRLEKETETGAEPIQERRGAANQARGIGLSRETARRIATKDAAADVTQEMDDDSGPTLH